MRFLFSLLLVLLVALPEADAQTDTAFYAVRGNRVQTRAESKTYTVTGYKDGDTTQGISRTYLTLRDRLIHESPYSGYMQPLHHGLERSWDSTGKLMLESHAKFGKLHGTFRTYYPNGSLKREETYDYGVRLSGTCLDINGKQVPFYEYYVSPKPYSKIDLNNFLAERISYSRNMRKQGVQGTIVVSFIVNKKGSVTYVQIEKGIDPKLDKQVEDAVYALHDGKPGYVDGQPYPIKVTLPITFTPDNRLKSNGPSFRTLPFIIPLPGIVFFGWVSLGSRNKTYQLQGATNYFEEPIYGPRP